MVGGKEEGLNARQLLHPVLQLSLVTLRCLGPPLPMSIRGVADCCAWQCARVSLSLVKSCELILNDVHAPAVRSNMMHDQKQHVT